ncbi:MAG: ABC transporter permease [Gemmatimonadales bacterium]
MNKIFAVIRREFIARVRTKAFIFSTLALPVFFILISVVPALMMRGSSRTMRVAIVDATSDSIGSAVAAAMAPERTSASADGIARYQVTRVQALHRADSVRDSLVAHTGLARSVDPSSLDGVLVLTDSTLRTGKAEYLGSNASSMDAMGQLESTLSHVLMSRRLEESGVDPTLVGHAMVNADLQTSRVANGKATGQSGGASFVIAYFMGFVLYIGVLLYGQQTMTSVIEEKTSRIMEVLASSLRPFQMLMGKVLGVGAVGLLQMTIWGGTVFVITGQRAHIAALFHVSADAMQQMPIPTMPPDLLVIFLLYFVLGFLLFGALYAAIGSMCNNIKDAQQYLMLVSMVLVFGFFGIFALMKDPTGGLGVTLSLIPFLSQFAMPVRWSLAAVPPIQLVISLASCLVALVLVTWIAGRIYRTGILMYGKKPSFRELVRWIGAK